MRSCCYSEQVSVEQPEFISANLRQRHIDGDHVFIYVFTLSRAPKVYQTDLVSTIDNRLEDVIEALRRVPYILQIFFIFF